MSVGRHIAAFHEVQTKGVKSRSVICGALCLTFLYRQKNLRA